MSKFLLPILLFFFLSEGYSQQAKIMGIAEQFSGEVLYIQANENPITKELRTIDSIYIENNASFSSFLSCVEAQWIYITTGIFQVYMFIEPGKKYEINLPPKTEKTEADIRNPFYKPLEAHIEVVRESYIDDDKLLEESLNRMIFQFDTTVASRNQDMLMAIQQNKAYNSDSLIIALEATYDRDTSTYFSRYRKYRYGIIKINSRDVSLQYIQDTYIPSHIPEIRNPAFMELFKEMFHEFIFYYSRTSNGKNIANDINRNPDARKLKDSLMNHPAVYNRTQAELIILNEIYNLYSKNYFNKESLLQLLDQVSESPECQKNAVYAIEIKKHLTRLKVGEAPPDFLLYNENRELVSLDTFLGKYTYLNFCTPDNYSCLKEYPFLKVLHNAHRQHLNIVTILVTEEYEEMNSFMQKNKYAWTSLFYGNNDKLLSEYNIRAYPTCYLLDPEGKLIQSPASLATEGLEQQLFRIMRARGDL